MRSAYIPSLSLFSFTPNKLEILSFDTEYPIYTPKSRYIYTLLLSTEYRSRISEMSSIKIKTSEDLND